MLGLRLCLYDYLHQETTPPEWKIHSHPACLAIKRDHQSQCAVFCGQEVIRELREETKGRIHTCPFGRTEIAIPISLEGLFCGVLFAGAIWTGTGRMPHKSMVQPKDSHWLEDCMSILTLVARQIENLMMQPSVPHRPIGRKTEILKFLAENLSAPIRLESLAEYLDLSPSRTSHVVRELFDRTFQDLLRSLRIAKAARLLTTTDLPASQIALDAGFADQSHLTRAFTQQYRMPPIAYRKAHMDRDLI